MPNNKGPSGRFYPNLHKEDFLYVPKRTAMDHFEGFAQKGLKTTHKTEFTAVFEKSSRRTGMIVQIIKRSRP